MAKRILRVTKWLGMTPAVAACAACEREFKAPISALSRTRDAQDDLQQQFDSHVCEMDGSSRASKGTTKKT